ncbi:MAG: LemA family protein [Kiritimatiellia bacterium]|jgi:LemA protein
MQNVLTILVVVVVVLAVFAIGIYNSLVTLRQRYKNAFSQIDVQLKRRYDLIPNLVETAKGYMKHERETLEAVIQARNLAMNASQQAGAAVGQPDAMRSLNQAEGQLSGALARLMVVVERYPELKADKNMALLQEEITATENKVAFARQAYNDAVTAYNTKRELFPANLFAGLFGFLPASLFEITRDSERDAPKVQF